MSRPLLSRALVVPGTALLLATGLGCGQVDAGAGEDDLPTTVTVPGPAATPVPLTVAPTTTIRLPKGTMFTSEDGRFRVQLRTRPRFQRAFLVENRMYFISAFSPSETPPPEYPAALATFALT